MVLAVEVENRSGWRVDAGAVRRVVEGALRSEGVADGEAGVALVDEEEMAQLNALHRGRQAATDVLSFPLDGRDQLPAGLPRQLGDLVVCPAVAERDGTPLELLLVHGVLHLLGWDHEADAGEMLVRQAEVAAEVERVGAAPS
jgi:probable rRNA maturation factor